ncbi:hypothetical protein BC834DRAFT_968555 [Gloeopeniophorella convolvens]|nr:hypothetical protein BC834DRAFT_968555 [Gloeopeniophorella convolvens]
MSYSYQWPSAGDGVRTRQHRASTTPAPAPVRPPLPPSASMPIPPSLIPGFRHRQTISVSSGVDNLLFNGPGISRRPVSMMPTTLSPVSDEHFPFPSPYPQQQEQQWLPPPPPPPLPPHRTRRPAPAPTPPAPFPPKLPLRRASQPPPPLPRGASPPFLVAPPPKLPPKPPSVRVSMAPARLSTVDLNLPPPGAMARAGSSGQASLILPSLAPSPLESEDGGGSSSGISEDQELALALRLSAHADREYVESLLSQDEQLARALQESLLDHPPPPRALRPGLVIPHEPRRSPPPAHPYSPTQPTHSPRFLAPGVAGSSSRGSSVSSLSDRLADDEGVSRRVGGGGESSRSGQSTPTTQSVHEVYPQSPDESALPRYADLVPQSVPQSAASLHRESDAAAHTPPPSPPPPPPPPLVLVSVPVPIRAEQSVPATPDPARVSPRPASSPERRSSPRPVSVATSPSASEEEGESAESSSSSRLSRAFMSPHQFVEPELLYGVSFGFHTPPMDVHMMRDPLPNIISLPYGRCPPMHIQAPSWRQLLKLMAKLSATRVEPSVEAVAATKGELKLRTVIQFFKVHHASPDWRTVIYLTIDHPPPKDHRYTNGDVNVLPYSYNLSSLPTLLRDGPESQVARYYTIPATSSTPLPKLPITLPSMAMYLASR